MKSKINKAVAPNPKKKLRTFFFFEAKVAIVPTRVQAPKAIRNIMAIASPIAFKALLASVTLLIRINEKVKRNFFILFVFMIKTVEIGVNTPGFWFCVKPRFDFRPNSTKFF